MALTPYLPVDRLLALLAEGDLPDRASGVALFADLAGFTPMAESLAQQLGPQLGAEELTRQLNLVFGVLVEQADRYAGSVVSFSGDAVTCWFDELPNGLDAPAAPAALRAAACALCIQQGIGELAPVALPDGTHLILGLKIALAGGPIRRFAIGDPGLGRIDVLAGATLDLLSAVEQLALRDEVLLDGATARALGAALSVADWRADPTGEVVAARISALHHSVHPTPWPSLPLPSPQADATARSWLIPEVAARIMAGSGAATGHLLADLRRAVALFLSFGGIDYDRDEDAPVLLDRFVRRVQAIGAAYGGALLQLTMGDKGSYLYLAFGAPVAQTNAAANAVAAAQALLTLASELDFIDRISIGIAQGQMYCGDYGGPGRRTYGVLGDATNVAARLMSTAGPGTICCDEGVYKAARRRWQFRELSPVQLKGKGTPLAVFAPGGPRPAPSAPQVELPLGRDAELRRGEALLDELQAGTGAVLTITGEAGMGKSLLAGLLARRAVERGIVTLQGSALSNERQTPYRAWRDILEGLCGLDATSPPEARRRQVLALLSAASPELDQRAPLLNDVLHLELPETPLTASLDARLRQDSLQGLVVILLTERLSRGPLLLLLEDAQWLDGLSWLLTVGVARALLGPGAPLLLILVQRPAGEGEPMAAHLAALHDLPRAESIALEGLEEAALTALAARRLGLSPAMLPPAVAGLVVERASGNPFFVEELIDNLRDNGLVSVALDAAGQPRCSVSRELELGRSPLPETVEGLVLARIDRLPAEQQLLLKVAAVIGRSFGEPPLHATLRRYTLIELGALRAYLASLTRRDLTLVEGDEPEPSYAFKHSITHRVAYETLLFGQRAELHLAVASWYEQIYAGRLEAYYPLLAHHYGLAGEQAGEARYAWLAGVQAAALYANEDALTYLGRALELTARDDLAHRFELLLERERVHDMLARREAQAADVRAIEALAERSDDDGLRVTAALRRAVFAERVSDYGAGVTAAARAAALAVARADVAAEAHARERWGALLWKQARYEEAREQLEGALAIAKAWELPAVEASALYFLASVAISRGQARAAAPLYEAALAIYRRLGNRRSEANTVTGLSVAASFTGDYVRAHELNVQALAIYRATGDRQGEAFALNNLADDHMAFGDYLAARSALVQALALFRAMGSWEGEGWTLNNMGEVAILLGEYGQALADHGQALAIARAVDHVEDEALALYHLGLAAHLNGDDRAALAHSEEAVRLADAIGQARSSAYALTIRGHALYGLGRLDEAAASYEAARALRAGMDEPALLFESLAGLARVALARGATAEALAHVEPILAHLATAPLTGADEPARVELTCYEALLAADDPRAPAALAGATARLQERAARIGDEGARQRFLNAVAAHRALLEHARGRGNI